VISASAKVDRENEQSAEKVRELLAALERVATRIVATAQQAAGEAKEDKFKAYVEFRNYVDDFDTLAIVIEYKIKRLRDARSGKLTEKFVELTGFMLSAIVSASLHFLRILAEKKELRLGSSDVFMSELRSLYHAKERIESERYAHLLTDRTKSDLAAAEQILDVVIERAPKLLNFDE
jgi:soluble cytochrome b562